MHKHSEYITAYIQGSSVQYKNPYGTWVEVSHLGIFDDLHAEEFRLTPIKGKFRVALMKYGYDQYTTVTDSDSDAVDLSVSEEFIRWLTPWTEYEV